MRQRAIHSFCASLVLASFLSGAQASDLPSVEQAAEDFPFPVLESASPEQAPRYPYLSPVTDDKIDWPPLFKQPEPVLSDGPKRVPSHHVSEMDQLPPVPEIAIVIDDVGYNRRGMEETLALPLQVVLAILPETPYAKKAAHKAYLQQRATILHAPMENQRALKLGPGGLYQSMDEQAFKQALRTDLDNVPHVRGANNHMGSLLTTRPDHMNWVMDIMAERSLFFIDSLTSADSVAYQTAKERGVKTLTRDVFLDNVRTDEAINQQFERLLAKAHKYGHALAIGHPYPETTAYLKRRLAEPLSAQLVEVERLLE
ncbi:divergent polysaccharide deacetylase family protein [Marinomonas ostreistagni]|uniref:divergent polysaccharide deacetylase family protein n=1 Tax=Marinomonas ostreistagni TaxID=359209 RepID=UPI00194DC9B1|nr:divergent polysaccharide deacetylase family protein [Marinomonas ostreistagni]MBM6552260.1 divergent polysaccharide deacetylase family protein [Marinomonas ostreistagni]